MQKSLSHRKLRTKQSISLSSSRQFSTNYDSGSAVSTPRGPKTQNKQKQQQSKPKPNHIPPLQSRYEQLQHKNQSLPPTTTKSASSTHKDSPKGAQQQQQQGGENAGSLGPNAFLQNGTSRKLATNDFDSVFKNSRLSNLFTQQQTHQSFWSRMEDGDTVHLIGTRRLVDPHGTAQENTFCLVQRTVDKNLNQILDRYVALDYDSGMPFEQYLTTSLEENGSNGTAIDKDQESGDVIARTFLRLRGDPWKWHSAVAMSKIEPRIKAHMSEEYVDSLPDTYAVSRTKFTENGFLTEKMIRQNDLVVLTVVDELKITTKKIFEARVEKIFAEYSQMLQEQIEKNAQEYEEGQDDDFKDFDQGGMDFGDQNNKGTPRM